MRIRQIRAVLYGAVGVMLFGGGAAYGAPPVPCALLTTEQVGGVLGATVKKPMKAGPKICQWIQTGLSGPNGTKKVMLVMMPANTFATRLTPVPAPVTRTQVTGLGDAANYEMTPMGGTLAVKKGDVYFLLQVRGVPAADQQAMETTLAKDILANL